MPKMMFLHEGPSWSVPFVGAVNDRTGGILADRIAVAKIGGQGAVAALNVGGKEEPLAVFVNGEADGAAELVLLS